MGFEPTTPTLARLCSTPELRPPLSYVITQTQKKCNSGTWLSLNNIFSLLIDGEEIKF